MFLKYPFVSTEGLLMFLSFKRSQSVKIAVWIILTYLVNAQSVVCCQIEYLLILIVS